MEIFGATEKEGYKKKILVECLGKKPSPPRTRSSPRAVFQAEGTEEPGFGRPPTSTLQKHDRPLLDELNQKRI